MVTRRELHYSSTFIRLLVKRRGVFFVNYSVVVYTCVHARKGFEFPIIDWLNVKPGGRKTGFRSRRVR